MINETQHAELAQWLKETEKISPAEDEIVGTLKTLEYYVNCWGPPQETVSLESGAALSIWRGNGYAFWVVDFGDVRAAAVY